MSKPIEKYLHNCLYFTANSLARRITAMAEEAFGKVGLSPSHAFLVMLVNEQPGISQKELSRALNLAPSTVTRFVDSLNYARAWWSAGAKARRPGSSRPNGARPWPNPLPPAGMICSCAIPPYWARSKAGN